VNLHWLAEVLGLPYIKLMYVKSQFQLADVFTKAFLNPIVWSGILSNIAVGDCLLDARHSNDGQRVTSSKAPEATTPARALLVRARKMQQQPNPLYYTAYGKSPNVERLGEPELGGRAVSAWVIIGGCGAAMATEPCAAVLGHFGFESGYLRLELVKPGCCSAPFPAAFLVESVFPAGRGPVLRQRVDKPAGTPP